MVNYSIRPGTKEDLASAIGLVKELAIFEKEPNAVLIGRETYEKSFDEGLFKFLVAEHENLIVGIAIYYTCFSTWKGKSMYLEDLIVTDKFRNLGIGQRLFDKFIEEAKKASAVQVKWQVLDWNQHAIRFYIRNKAKIDKEWFNGVIVF
jgi:ribosomal protein S18 acetylase RimI-like enzyme